jgi:hypothetical protein
VKVPSVLARTANVRMAAKFTARFSIVQMPVAASYVPVPLDWLGRYVNPTAACP